MAREIYRGNATYCVYADETAFGTGGTPSASGYFGKVDNVSLDWDNNIIQSQGIGEGRNVTVATYGNFTARGSLSGEVIDFTPFRFMVGYLTGAGTSGDPYELTESNVLNYTAGVGNGLKTAHLEVGASGDANNSIFDITGCWFENLSLSGSQGANLKFSTSFSSSYVTKSTAGILTYASPAAAPFVCNNIALENGSGDAINVTDFSWTLENQADQVYEIGSRFSTYLSLKLRKYTFTYTLLYDYNDAASTLSAIEMLELFFGTAAANSPIAATATPTASTLRLVIDEGSASGDRDGSIDLENCYFTTWSHPVNLGDGKISVTLSGFGFAGLTDGAVNVPIRWYTN